MVRPSLSSPLIISLLFMRVLTHKFIKRTEVALHSGLN